ncbi:MAG: electron transfer flavoprotein subunit alpha/FixB family protein [Gemmatimonadetes bacterium]|nr:electron transfer flavoprotein subunit alpha/FixB family protein [Gemmatimonadota bacterium]
MAGAIWAVAQLEDGRPKGVSFETVAAAQKLGEALGKPVEAVVMGSGARSAAEAVAAKELEAVRLIDDPKLDPYTPDPYAAAMTRAVEAESPDYVLFPHTYQVRDWVPRLAAALDAGFVSDVVAFRVEEGTPVFVRQPYQGKLNADCVFADEGSDGVRFVSLQAGAYLASDAAAGDAAAEIVEQEIDLGDLETRTEVVDTFQEVVDKVDLSRADVIVAVGRGIGKEERLDIVRELADALGGQLAASRPVCDNEWLPMDRQIGSSGQTVAPKLYLAVGISGAIQHLVGMKNSGTIVAINKDPNAPIFAVSDYGIVGDLFEVVPALTQKVKEARGAA